MVNSLLNEVDMKSLRMAACILSVSAAAVAWDIMGAQAVPGDGPPIECETATGTCVLIPVPEICTGEGPTRSCTDPFEIPIPGRIKLP